MKKHVSLSSPSSRSPKSYNPFLSMTESSAKEFYPQILAQKSAASGLTQPFQQVSFSFSGKSDQDTSSPILTAKQVRLFAFDSDEEADFTPKVSHSSKSTSSSSLPKGIGFFDSESDDEGSSAGANHFPSASYQSPVFERIKRGADSLESIPDLVLPYSAQKSAGTPVGVRGSEVKSVKRIRLSELDPDSADESPVSPILELKLNTGDSIVLSEGKRLGVGGQGEVWMFTLPDASRIAVKIGDGVTQEMMNMKAHASPFTVHALSGNDEALLMKVADGDLDSLLKIAKPVIDRLAAEPKKLGFFLADMFYQMALPVYQINLEGKSHHDIKPPNYLVFGRTLQLGDFGILKPHGERSGATWEIAAPERFPEASQKLRLSSLPQPIMSDAFSLGACFYTVLTGDHYFNAFQKVDSGNPAYERHVSNFALGEGLEELSSKALPRQFSDFQGLVFGLLAQKPDARLRLDVLMPTLLEKRQQYAQALVEQGDTDPDQVLRDVWNTIHSLK